MGAPDAEPYSHHAEQQFTDAAEMTTMSFHSADFTSIYGRHRQGGPASTAIVDELLLRARQTLDSDLGASRDCLARASALLDERASSGEPDQDRDRRRSPSSGTQLPAWGVKKLEAFIAENLDRTLYIETLAGLVRLSCSHFSRACKNTFGLTPHALLMHRRIERCQALMAKTGQPLSQIAYACGFADQAHMSRTFRQFVGASPRDWRRDNASAPST